MDELTKINNKQTFILSALADLKMLLLSRSGIETKEEYSQEDIDIIEAQNELLEKELEALEEDQDEVIADIFSIEQEINYSYAYSHALYGDGENDNDEVIINIFTNEFEEMIKFIETKTSINEDEMQKLNDYAMKVRP